MARSLSNITERIENIRRVQSSKMQGNRSNIHWCEYLDEETMDFQTDDSMRLGH